ncbi:acetyltransferase (GNAT) family protein [Jatrophihabitans sp. GAS493]|uniref:GNAT family N-acetyltransferase n=1 Tax=Jatrophihabitans sp. GAS493 TaxID=1907575 RepID=UPI000BB7874F|nr:acetyltransferase (GNAT) family protein [Jatrophihabitans sp. GAS493]
MWNGWSFEQARERHFRYAQKLVDAGVTWARAAADDQPRVTALVREHILGSDNYEPEPSEAAVVAHDNEGAMIGALVLAGATFEQGMALTVRHLVVEPAWRGRGVGAVTLGLFAQLLGPDADAVAMTFGACGPGKAARFYQHAGFTVLDPGEPFKFPLGKRGLLVNENEHYPCWFFRLW